VKINNSSIQKQAPSGNGACHIFYCRDCGRELHPAYILEYRCENCFALLCELYRIGRGVKHPRVVLMEQSRGKKYWKKFNPPDDNLQERIYQG